jgi:hypothetical protein
MSPTTHRGIRRASLQLSSEGTLLESSGEDVELLQVDALAGLRSPNTFDDGGEAMLGVDGWERNVNNMHQIAIQRGNAHAASELLEAHQAEQFADPHWIVAMEVLDPERRI